MSQCFNELKHMSTLHLAPETLFLILQNSIFKNHSNAAYVRLWKPKAQIPRPWGLHLYKTCICIKVMICTIYISISICISSY